MGLVFNFNSLISKDQDIDPNIKEVQKQGNESFGFKNIPSPLLDDFCGCSPATCGSNSGALKDVTVGGNQAVQAAHCWGHQFYISRRRYHKKKIWNKIYEHNTINMWHLDENIK